MEQMLRNTEKVVQQFLNYPSMTQVPLSDLHDQPVPPSVRSAPDAENDAAERVPREEERHAMLKAVQGLQLQSVMCGDARKACMINNTLYREGQTDRGFTIEKISPNAVIVKNGAVPV